MGKEGGGKSLQVQKRDSLLLYYYESCLFYVLFNYLHLLSLNEYPTPNISPLFKVNENSSDINIFNLAEGFAPFSPQHQFETELSKEEPLSLFDIWLAAPSYQ